MPYSGRKPSSGGGRKPGGMGGGPRGGGRFNKFGGPGGGRPGPGGPGGRSGGPGGPGGRGGSRFFQKKVCRMCTEAHDKVSFKNLDLIKRYLTEKGKILPRRITGNCAKCQRELARLIKRARHASLVAFTIN